MKKGAELKQSRNKSAIGEVEDKIYLLTAPYVNLFWPLHLSVQRYLIHSQNFAI